MKWTFFFSIFLLIFFVGQLSAQTNGCPWAGLDRTICPGGSVLIGCSDIEEYCYKWEPEEGLNDPRIVQPTASPEETTTYTLYVVDDNGNIVGTDWMTVFISEPVKISPEVILLCGQDEENELSYSPDFSQVVWSTGETSEIIEINEAGTYSITATDVNGCESTDEISVYNNENITNEQIAQLLEDAGFMKIPVEILDEPPGFSRYSGIVINCTSDSPYLENLVGEVLIAEGLSSSYCLSDAVVGDLELGISEGINVGGIIMDNFCSGEYSLEDFLAYGNGEFDAVIQVYVMNLEDEDFLFVNTNNYQPFIESETVEGSVYPPNLDVIDDLSTGCTYRVRDVDGVSWGFYKNEEGRWLQDDIMEDIRRDDFTENDDPSGDLDNTCCDGESIDASELPWHLQVRDFLSPLTYKLRLKFDLGLTKSNLVLGCSGCYGMATKLKEAFYDGETRTLKWRFSSPISRYLRRLETTNTTIDQIDNKIESWYRSHDGLFDLFLSQEPFFNADINNPNYSNLLENFGGAALIGGTQNLSIKLTTVHEDCETGKVTIVYKLGVGDIFGAGKSDGAKWWYPGLQSQFLLQHFRNDDCTDAISDSDLCYTPFVHWVYFTQIFSFYVGV